jgi:N,N'-diacetyllegionaminate synthase
LGIRASQVALALGADWIERHFTIVAEDRTKDGPVSITPSLLIELRAFADLPRRERMHQLAERVPEWQATLGQARRSLSREELLNRDYYRGRFATRLGARVVYNWEDVSLETA